MQVGNLCMLESKRQMRKGVENSPTSGGWKDCFERLCSGDASRTFYGLRLKNPIMYFVSEPKQIGMASQKFTLVADAFKTISGPDPIAKTVEAFRVGAGG